MMMDSGCEIDDTLYSRQRYVLGDSAMHKMAKSTVLVYGLGGLGIEIAKNIVLAGVKSLTIQDAEAATASDLGVQFFLREVDVLNRRNRAESSCPRVAELNPYVSVDSLTTSIDENTDLSYLKKYQCVVLTEVSLKVAIKVNDYCRTQQPPIKFILGQVYGVFGSVFCDFGAEFEVMDTDGEESRENFISTITKANPGVVTCLDDIRHGLETGDVVTFKEVRGMEALNGRMFPVKVMSPFSFTICDTTSDEFGVYQRDGIFKQIKLPKIMQFSSLSNELCEPTCILPDLSKFEAPNNIHLGMYGLHSFREKYNRLPDVWCDQDANELLKIVRELSNQLKNKIESIDETLIKNLSYTSRGVFAPLCATLGGIIAQEALKALTGKFTPLSQWLYLDVCEVLPAKPETNDVIKARNDRYDGLRICIGEELCEKVANLKVFMVGCGAIGCEMMKNYALLGVGSAGNGKITITDNDLIEKSNLNRQFLFRPHHIQKPKSVTAAQSTLDINPQLNIEAQQHKVCPQTENSVYTDEFFCDKDLCVNALDNVEARRYMDARCITNQTALLESGTMGTKGHVQAIVPHLTESYTSQVDPPDLDAPFCTIKSFPSSLEHCIQWARDKFESAFSQKPALFNKFWSEHTPKDVIQKLTDGCSLDGAIQVSKTSSRRVYTFEQCVSLARLKFTKDFDHKAKNLLHAFPLDTKLPDGSLFWQSPKRPPTPLEFTMSDELCLLYIVSTARLFADVWGIKWTEEDMARENILRILQRNEHLVPEFVPSNKRIETDENSPKPANKESSLDDEQKVVERFQKVLSSNNEKGFSSMFPVSFEKDDDSNGHIDFIYCCASLRAMMYNIEREDRLHVKRIAGRIVPAIATTTAAVSGLVSIELLKLVKQVSLEEYKNCFLNLALPIVVLSEPGPVQRTIIKDGLSFTLWDFWKLTGNKDFTLQQFINHFKEKYGFEASAVLHGARMVYVPIMPGHKKRLNMTMVKLLKPTRDKKYMDLIVSLETDSHEDVPGPPVRYYFGL
ncbi:ubiquitin-like modifier-activating enzyme 6 [Tubulanus polymorphus]|uniref:ubiquitin-like modifier-activating enzyme 6 n=1 Tax=Tubulanus polymorphus TaxID=672921 RepID=UPI003DA5BA82